MNTIYQYTRRDGTVVNRSVESLRNYVRQDGTRALYVNLEGQMSFVRLIEKQSDGRNVGRWDGQTPSAEQEAQAVAIIRAALKNPTARLGDWPKLPSGQYINAPRPVAPRQSCPIAPSRPRYTHEEIESGRADEDMDFAGPDYTSR